MDAFSYLSVLLSIIIGLAITQVLQGYRAILLGRERVTLAWAPILWSGLLILFATQAWWASFGLRKHDDWSFLSFTFVLLQMVMLYMMAAVVLPDVGGETVDLEQHFAAHKTAFFAFMLALLATSVLKDVLLNGELPETRNLIFHAILAGAALVGIFAPNRAVQLVLPIAAAGGFAAYIVVLFARL